jgi:alkanesulfonate monooxygenase SsuD/methylene tetrahydromethanopterin reductase-like flavin-dependent oxidoreductase (luciferase family)
VVSEFSYGDTMGPSRGVRLGVVILPDGPWSQSCERWRRAEEYGFAHAWTYDHVGWRDLIDGPWYDSVATLTAAAGATSRIRLGPMVASPNLRHPVSFARAVTALDDVSGGRVLLGLGAGGTGYDATVFGATPLNPRARADRFAEFVELLDRILTQPTGGTTWRGLYYGAVDARSTPGCVQSPRVPFVLAAAGPRTMALAARFAQGWVTNGGVADDQAAWWRSVSDRAGRFDEALATADREPSTVDRYLMLDPAPEPCLASPESFAEAVGRAGKLGFTDAVTHWPRASGWYAGDERVLAAVAPG